MEAAQRQPEFRPSPDEEKEIKDSLEVQQLKDFLYAKAISPDTSPEIKKLLGDPFEIYSASEERLRELQDYISGKKKLPDNILPFRKREEN